MEQIQWSEKISVNNHIIDRQHKTLIKLTNKLISHSNKKTSSKIINETLTELLKYTQYHFQDEEKLMKQLNYPNFENHKIQHKEFIYKVTMFCKDVLDQKKTITDELITFLTDWIIHHTSNDDQDFKNYI